MLSKVDQLDRRIQTRGGNLAVLSVGLIGAVLTFVPVAFGFHPSDVALIGAFLFGFLIMLWIPHLRCLALGSRVLLILFTLRPLLDAAQSQDARQPTFPLQNIFALVIVFLLLVLWRRGDFADFLTRVPNIFFLALLALTVVAWGIGGLSAGANGFLRTSWGLLLAVMLGPVFRTDKQTDIFIRTLFYSSGLVLIILAFNLKEGEFIGDVWRISGQFGVANTLAAVSFSLFALGLYTFEQVRTSSEKMITLLLLLLLAAVIFLAQSRTVAGLLFITVFVWLWAEGHRRVFYLLAICLLVGLCAVVFGYTLASHWRFTSSFSLQQGELSEDVVNLTGRTYLWAKTFEQFANASILHKVFGLGWGAVFANFETLGYELSSVTENSFLWFLVGSGILGLIAFSAYLVCAMSRAWKTWHHAASVFERRLALLTFIVVLTFVVEGFTTDLVLSPVSSSYLYAILSLFVSRSIRSVRVEPSYGKRLDA
jgi:O-antigen ligase